jgi:FlaA1/EpsC-like NDP-sugar epimerase
MSLLSSRTPRWIIFLLDIFIALCAMVLAYLLRFNFSIPQPDLSYFPFVILYSLAFKAIGFVLGKTYSGLIRYSGFKDAQRIVLVLFLVSIFFSITNLLSFNHSQKFYIPFSIIVIDFIASVFGLVGIRIIINTIYLEFKQRAKIKSRVIIIGAAETAIASKRAIERDGGSKYRVIAFVDDNKKIIGNKIEGIKIFSYRDLNTLLTKQKVSQVIISIQNLPSNKKNEITEMSIANGARVLTVPPVTSWINGELSIKQIKKVKVEELLEREPIVLNNKKIESQLSGKVVLISGAAGSIGSEMVRQIAKFKPQKMILLDNAESNLYEIEMEMLEAGFSQIIEVVICDIRNEERLNKVFKYFNPTVIYHAAAYKHVPMMENNPTEAIMVNVIGTRNLADLAIKNNVDYFVMVSTDKAVNPTNVMGASKRIAEIYCQSLNSLNKTKFITTRFGNVFDSNGSVIPRFRKQIENGGPLTVTHPDITRFFMTISEASQLVLEAGSMGNGGEVFVFDMGKPVKILDLAKKMIKLSGLELDRDIKITFSGLRPGEKLFEELLVTGENSIPTHHTKILIAKVISNDLENIKVQLDELKAILANQNNFQLVKKMKEIVPEYISNNSVFEELDAVK